MTSQSLAVTRDMESYFDRLLSEIPCFQANQELCLSPLLPREFILAKNYVHSFRHHALLVHNAINESEQHLLSPTCCYPVFKHFMNSTVPETHLVTHKNICFRCEGGYELGVRQASFLMREYIFFSTKLSDIEEWIQAVKHSVAAMLRQLGLAVTIQKARDPFFNPTDFKGRLQEAENLKSEFIVGGIALASVNSHLKSFSKSCGIKSDKSEYFYSACFGLGYDRLSTALRSANGMPVGDVSCAG